MDLYKFKYWFGRTFRRSMLTISYKMHRYFALREFETSFEEKSRRSLQRVKNGKKLSREQKKEILDFYRSLTGKKVPLIDHQYFYSRTGIYTKDYMPQALFVDEILGRANNMEIYMSTFVDKNFADMLIPQKNQPNTFLKNMNGYYYYNSKPVSKEEAINMCQNIEEAMIKPSRGSAGDGVQKISVKDGVTNLNGKSIADLFEEYQKDFQLQSVVHQHEEMASLNPTSVNTIRIATYRSGMEVLVVYSAIRIGRSGQVIDNQSAGGISAKINPDGTLAKYAFGKAGDDKIEKTDTGIVLDGFKVPSYDKAIDMVKTLHLNLPFFNYVGWDVCIQETGEPILIEWNGRPGPSQTACGTGIGELTERIIQEVWPRPNTFKKLIRERY